MSTGKITKSTTYRKDLLKRTESMPDHPINNGVSMQAHHIISADGIKNIKKKEIMKLAGYDINHHKNLVFIPNSFQGACHLNAQLHRGNHTSTVPYIGDVDDEHPRSYHNTVDKYVRELLNELGKDCVDSKSDKEGLISDLNKVSVNILNKINDFSPNAQLTRVYQCFDPEGEHKTIGCSGVKKMDDHNEAVPCPHKRNHSVGNKVSEFKHLESFVFTPKMYKLKVGR